MAAKAKVRGAAADTDTPSGEVVKASAPTKTVTTKLGRTLVVRKPSALNRLRLYEIIGPSAAQNRQYLGHAGLACSVVSIDGEPVAFPTSKRELEALVQRLDDDGLDAAGFALAELTGIKVDEDGNIIESDDVDGADAAKN